MNKNEFVLGNIDKELEEIQKLDIDEITTESALTSGTGIGTIACCGY